MSLGCVQYEKSCWRVNAMEKYLNHEERKELELNYNKMKLKARLEINSSIKKFLAKCGKIKRYDLFNKKIRTLKKAKETYHGAYKTIKTELT